MHSQRLLTANGKKTSVLGCSDACLGKRVAGQWSEVCRKQISNLNLLLPEGGGTRPTLPMNHTLPGSSRSRERAWEVSDKRSGRTVSTACHVDERLEDVEVRVAQA